jgi:DNA-binding response OmpR family regulator
MRILIVEDEMIAALDLQSTLEQAGHSVVGPAMTTAEALVLIEYDCPDLALVNINLKDGQGAGIELARILLERCGVPSLFISGQIHEARENRDAALGYLGKPWRPKTLLASIAVADRIIHGKKADPVPSGLELFKDKEQRASD